MHADVSGSLSRANWISLRLWVFKFIDVEDVDSFGVCVEGYRPSDETETVLRNWHSTAIEKRVTPHLLHSCTGSVYELRGSIDKDLACQYGYPAELVALFTNGFPENWRSILKEYFYVVKTTNPMNASYYFSTVVRRRSSSVARRIDILSTSGFSSQNNRRSQRLSILPPPAVLPVAIEEEEEEEKENSTPNVSNVSAFPKKTPKSGDNKSKASSFTPRRSSRISKIPLESPKIDPYKSKDTAVHTLSPTPTLTLDDKEAVNSRTIRKRSPNNPKKDDTYSPEISFIVTAPLNANLSEKLSDAPGSESPLSCASQQHEDDCSAGPVFADSPSHQSQEIHEIADDIQRNGDTMPNDLAVVPIGSDVFKVPSGRPIKRRSHENAVELSSWSIRFAPLDCGGPELGFPKFILLGRREGHDKQWYSSIVVRVESAEILHTSSNTYRLVGDMDIIDSANAGFPKLFVARFLRGFPPDWKTRITELYNTFFGNLKITTNSLENCENAKPTLSFCDDSEFKEPANEQLQRSHWAQGASSSNAGCSRDNDLDNDRAARQAYNVRKERSFVNDNDFADDWDGNAAVLRSNSSSSSEIRRSRSGRCSHPPLAQWAGERVRYDGFGNVIGVEGIATATVHARGSTGAMNLSKYYGVSPARPSQSEVYLNAPKLAVDDGPKRIRRRKALVTYSDSSDEDNVSYLPKRRKPILDMEIPVHKSHQQRQYRSSTESDDSEIERELRTERRLILEQARELQRQQKNLLEMERRIAFHEKKWKKKKAKRRHIEKIIERRYPSLTWSNVERRREKIRTEHPKQRKRHIAENGNDENWKEVMIKDQLVKEWAREDEELSSSENSDGDVDWRVPARKKKKQIRKVKKPSSSSDVASLSAEESEDSSHSDQNARTSSRLKKVVPRKEKRWDKAELDRLKLALAAVRVQTDEDWEKIARSLGNDRDPESCKQAAIKRLKWQPCAEESNSQVITSERITARAGTIAFQHQANEFTRKFMLTGGPQSDDFFKNTDITANNSMSMAMLPDLTDFAADDSLLEVLHTPSAAVAERKVSNRRQFLAEAIEDDDSPVRRRSSAVLMETPKDSAQRERQNRYFHHLISKGGCRDVSRMNFSRVGNSTRMETTAARMDPSKIQNFGSLHEDLDYAAKMTKKAARGNRVIIEDSDGELELDGESMDDFDDDVLS